MSGVQKKAFALRIDPVLWRAIERLATRELRSTNAQAEFLLRETLIQRGLLAAKAGVTGKGEGPGKVPAPQKPSGLVRVAKERR